MAHAVTVPSLLLALSAIAAVNAQEVTINDGDTSWMLTSTALVFIMTPGLAFFYGGLVRNKSVLNTLLMNFIAMGIITLHWVILGYSFSFAGKNGGFGGFDYAGLKGVGQEPNTLYAPTIPHNVFMMFQMMFAIITPALISGAVVERMKFSSYIIFLVLWTTLVYDPVAHWVWSSWEETNDAGEVEVKFGWIRDLGAIDFAGGTVVHITSGMSGLVASYIVGKRNDVDLKSGHSPSPANIPFVLLGGALLWFGWFGFNAGSALLANGLAGVAFASTHIAAATAFVTWMVLDFFYTEKWSVVGGVVGSVVGLVAITPAAGYVYPISGLAFGFLGALGSYFALKLKPKVLWMVDDSLDVFYCHGIGGVIGAFLTGLFASKDVNGIANGSFFDKDSKLLGYQIVAILVVSAHAMIMTAVILFVLRRTVGLTLHTDNIDEALHDKKTDFAELEEQKSRPSPSPSSDDTKL